MTEDQMDKQDLTSLSEDERFQMLLLASVEGRTNIVNEILASCIPKKGSASAPSLSRVDSGGLSALHHAVLHRHLDVVRLLLRAGAPADLFAGEGGPHVGKTAWGLLPEVDKLKEGEAKAEKSASDNDADTQEALLAARRVFGAELLQCAALGDVERTQQLLRSGVSPHVQLGTANAGGKDQTVAELALELGGSALNNPAVALLVDACGDEPSSGKPSPSSAPPTQQQRQDVATISSMPFDLMFRTEDSTVENDRSNSQKDDWISGLATPTFVRYHIRVSVEPVGGVAPEWCPFGDEDEEVDEENASPSPSSSPQSQEAQSPPRTACPSYLIRRRFREFVDLLVSLKCLVACYPVSVDSCVIFALSYPCSYSLSACKLCDVACLIFY